MQRVQDRVHVGFGNRGIGNGLGFSFLAIEDKGDKQEESAEEFVMRPLERGYYHNSQLCGMGEKWFKNGNYYFGDFKDGIFEGRGLLKNTSKQNWVYGVF